MNQIWMYFGLVALCFFAPTPAHGHDWLRHLETKHWTFLAKPAGLADHLREYPFEWYLVEDENKRQFAVLTGYENTLVGMLAAHEFAEILGLKHFPVWPTLIKRGVNFPNLIEDKIQIDSQYALAPDATLKNVDVVVQEGPWRLALLMPVTTPQVFLPEVKPKEVSLDHMLHYITSIALGAGSVNTRNWENRSHLYEISDVFKNLKGLLDQRTFNEMMKPLGHKHLQAYSAEDAAWIIERTSRFFDLLESLEVPQLKTIFDSYIHYESGRPEGRLFDGNVLYNLPRRFKQIRSLTEIYLRKRIAGPFKDAALLSRPVPPQALMVAKKADPYWRNAEIFSDVPALRTKARHYLEAFATTPPQIRFRLVDKWTEQLAGDDPIKALMDIASVWDGSVRLTKTRAASVPRLVPSPNAFKQFFLNRHLPKTFVVYSVSDREGEAIHELLQELSQTLPLVPHKVEIERGRFLTPAQFTGFAKRAKREGANRIVIVECGGFTESEQKLLEGHGLEVIQIDHHRDQNRSGWHRYSALEQLADQFGYDLNADQHLIGLMDRAGVRGLLQMGWDKPQIEAYLAPREGTRRMNAIRRYFTGAFDTDNELIISVTQFDAPMGALSHALALESFPRIPTLLVERPHSLIFSGPPEIVESVLESTPSRGRHVVWGGDYSSNLFAVIRPRGTTVQVLSAEIMRALKNGTTMTNPCVIEVVGNSF